MEINNSNLRVAKFTSSQIYRLCTSLKSGKPSSAFYTYVEEVFLSSIIKRSVKTDIKTQSMRWGSLMEVVLFNKIGLEYKMNHKETIVHKDYDFWSGTPDLISKDQIGEIKCFEPLHFAKLSLLVKNKDLEGIKQNEPSVYWQTVSNAILCGVKKAEIITYMPYKSELLEIIDMIYSSEFLEDNDLLQSDYFFMDENRIESLPYLPEDSELNNINTFDFEIPQEDIDFLTSRVLEAKKELDKIKNK